MTVYPQQKARLSDFVLYAHPLLFLVPWQPAPYKPEWFGPLDAWAIITSFLLAAAMAEGFLSGEWLVSRGFSLCAGWFTLSIIVGVTLGIAGLDSVRQNAPFHLQAGGMIPYVEDGMGDAGRGGLPESYDGRGGPPGSSGTVTQDDSFSSGETANPPGCRFRRSAGDKGDAIAAFRRVPA